MFKLLVVRIPPTRESSSVPVSRKPDAPFCCCVLMPLGRIFQAFLRVLNCQPHDVPILVAARLHKPLGNAAQNGIKFFATAELLELVKDRAWLVKVTNAVNQHWQRQNARKKSLAVEV